MLHWVYADNKQQKIYNNLVEKKKKEMMCDF